MWFVRSLFLTHTYIFNPSLSLTQTMMCVAASPHRRWTPRPFSFSPFRCSASFRYIISLLLSLPVSVHSLVQSCYIRANLGHVLHVPIWLAMSIISFTICILFVFLYSPFNTISLILPLSLHVTFSLSLCHFSLCQATPESAHSPASALDSVALLVEHLFALLDKDRAPFSLRAKQHAAFCARLLRLLHEKVGSSL